jgi:hypothetical protein
MHFAESIAARLLLRCTVAMCLANEKLGRRPHVL